MTIRARSQIVVERNDDQDSTNADDDYSLAFSSKGEREREREDGIARKTQKRFVFNTTTTPRRRKVKVKMHKKKSLQLPHKKSFTKRTKCPKTLSLLDPQQQLRSSRRRRFFASSSSPLPGRRSISTTRSPGRYCALFDLQLLLFENPIFFRISRSRVVL